METKNDPVLCKVLQYYILRRVGQITPTQYFNFTTEEGHELTHEEGVLPWNSRVIVPE